MKSYAAILLALLLVLSAVPFPVAADTKVPVFRAYVVDPVLEPGAETMVRVVVTNDPTDPEDVSKTAENVRVRLDPGSTPFTVKTGDVFVGTMNDSATREVAFRVVAPANVEAGEYDLRLRVTYEFDDAHRRTYDLDVPVRIEERVRFSVVDVESSAPVGGDGTLAITVQNTGELDAKDAIVVVESQSRDVTFDNAPRASQFALDWPAGENQTFIYDTSVAQNASMRGYALSVTVGYEDPDGARLESPPLAAGFVPSPEQSFSLQEVTSTLRVGDNGKIEGVVVNDGTAPVRNAVVRIEIPEGTAVATETEYAIGDLEPGASAPFSFEVETAANADAGPRQFTATVTYRDASGERRTSEELDIRAEVAPESPEFEISVENGTVGPGQTEEIRVTITNDRDETLTDISAKLYVEAPLSSSDSEAFIDELGPGESATLVFSVDAEGGALEKQYPAELDFRYEDGAGETVVSDVYRIPVTIEDTGGSGLPFGLTTPVLAVVVLVAAAGGAGLLVFRRRER
ncbi:COG1361 S-layer family protein [Haloferax sp. DFSO60]|uniref:COG1361 S-layer family protein n=1 Tax=Haloferax sp. DFSO60 TaxID=3388652 RepID=UPI00397E90CA